MHFNKLKNVIAGVAVLGMAASVNVFADTSTALKNIDRFIAQKNVDKTVYQWKLALDKPPKQSFNEGKRYLWNLQTTEGDISVELMPDVAPMHVTSTVYLTRLGFYDDIVFHRVIKGFMAQGGDPTGTGRRGPGYVYDGEFSSSAIHDRPGILSMANAGPGTDGSQFFLTFKPTNWLDGKHTVFGHVIQGMDTVKTIESYGSNSGQTSKKLKIVKATIEVLPAS